MTRRALVVGIDYPDTPYALRGCKADAMLWADVLRAKKFAVEIRTDAQATRAAILATLTRLLAESVAGDVLAFVYSGHGSNIRDDDGDEPDGRDECLVSVDLLPIRDDDIRAALAQLPVGVALTCVFDSCHSSGVSRFVGATRPSGGDVRARYLPAAALRSTLPAAPVSAARAARAVETAADVRWVELAACQSAEVAYEVDGAGVFTSAAIGVLRTSGPTLTHAGLMRRVVAALGDGASQHPQIRAPAGMERRTLVSKSVG